MRFKNSFDGWPPVLLRVYSSRALSHLARKMNELQNGGRLAG
jgi:hypothetical protein